MTPLALSRRRAAALLGIRPETVATLVRLGRLREVPWGDGSRIPLEDVERLAREGFTLTGKRPRPAPRRKAACDPEALRRLDVRTLARPMRGEP